MTYKLSPSRLSVYRDCPRCFWLEHNEDIERPEGKFSSYPMGVDLSLKRYFKQAREKGQIPNELKKRIKNRGLQLYTGDELKTWQTNTKGIQIEDEKGNVLKGAVDEMLYKKGKLVVVDFKTRGFLLKRKPDYYQDQMDIYNFLLRRNGKETEDYAYLIFYSPKAVKGENIVQNIEIVKMDTDPARAEQLFADAIKLLEGNMPEPRRTPKNSDDEKDKGCNYCTWYKKIKEL